MGETSLGWGIIGLGRIAETEVAPAISSLAGNELVAVVSRDQGRAERFAAAHNAAQALDDYNAMLSDPDVDAVYIATPNALHAEQVVAAAGAGKHVLCDKPLATSVADARHAIESCDTADVKLGIMFQSRYYGGMEEVAALVQSGAIGRIVIANVEMSGGRNLPKGWRTDPGLAGLGTINNIGVHGFDLLRFLLGAEATDVAVMIDQEPGFQLDTTAVVVIRFDNSTIACVNANQSIPNPRDDVVLYGTAGRVVAQNLSRPNREGTLSIIREGEQEMRTLKSTTGAYTAAIKAFSEAVAENREPVPGGLDGLRSVQLTEAIALAATEGRTVKLGSP